MIIVNKQVITINNNIKDNTSVVRDNDLKDCICRYYDIVNRHYKRDIVLNIELLVSKTQRVYLFSFL